MKFLIPTTFLLLIGAIVFLVLDRRETGENTQPTTSSPAPATQTPKSLRTPHLVKTLINPTLHLDEQIQAIRALPDDLSSREFQALIDLLYQDIPQTIDPAIWSTLQNEIMEVLRHARFDFPQYPTAIASILSDQGASPIMRDYAAQHLSLYLSDRAAKLPPEITQASLTSLITILTGSREANHQVTGTTLMALCDLNNKQGDLLAPHRPALGKAILHLLDQNNPATLSNRSSAIQAAGRLQIEEALPQIRQMSRSEAIKPTYRLNAIAALGYFAHPQDKSYLAQLATGQSKLRFAAQAALKNYQQ